MGCGAGKTTKETTLNSHIPAPSASKAVRQGKVASAGDKLPNEVLEGLERLLKRFARVEVKAKQRADARGGKKQEPAKTADDKKPQEKQPPTAPQMRDIATATADGTKRETVEAEEAKVAKAPTLTAAAAAFSQETALAKPDSEAPGESAQPVESSEPPAGSVPVGESVSANPIPEAFLQSEALPAEPRHAFEEDWSPHEDQRDSPEPPRPATLSDDEAQPYEDETLRNQRLEKERLALEEAERLAAQQRAVLEEQTLAQRGKMTSMQNQANDILAKYR